MVSHSIRPVRRPQLPDQPYEGLAVSCGARHSLADRRHGLRHQPLRFLSGAMCFDPTAGSGGRCPDMTVHGSMDIRPDAARLRAFAHNPLRHGDEPCDSVWYYVPHPYKPCADMDSIIGGQIRTPMYTSVHCLAPTTTVEVNFGVCRTGRTACQLRRTRLSKRTEVLRRPAPYICVCPTGGATILNHSTMR